MKLFKLFAVTLMLWPYLGIALLYLPEDAAPYLFFSLYLLLTVAVYGINIVNACRWKGEAERLAFWNMLIKLVHIPFHLLLFLVGLILILAMVVPALVFVSPILVMIFMGSSFGKSHLRLSNDSGGRKNERISSKLRKFITEIPVDQF